jgi:hypothetical protein
MEVALRAVQAKRDDRPENDLPALLTCRDGRFGASGPT